MTHVVPWTRLLAGLVLLIAGGAVLATMPALLGISVLLTGALSLMGPRAARRAVALQPVPVPVRVRQQRR